MPRAIDERKERIAKIEEIEKECSNWHEFYKAVYSYLFKLGVKPETIEEQYIQGLRKISDLARKA